MSEMVSQAFFIFLPWFRVSCLQTLAKGYLCKGLQGTFLAGLYISLCNVQKAKIAVFSDFARAPKAI